MTITLTPEQEAIINRKVATGDFTDASEVLDVALHLLSMPEVNDDPLPTEELRRAIAVAEEQFARGEYQPFDDESLDALFAEIEAGKIQRPRQSVSGVGE